MDYRKIEEYLDSEELDKILAGFFPIFEELNKYSEFLISKGDTLDNVKTKRLLMKATGYWGVLDTAFNTIDSFKTKKESDFYCDKKISVEKANEKFVSASADKEASAHVNPERRVRNIIESYRNRADKIISSCQSYLKSDLKAFNRAGDQEG